MQEELNLGAEDGPDGLESWRGQRAKQLRELSRTLGIPLGHRCRIELAGGVILEGLLGLDEDLLFLPEPSQRSAIRLRVDRCVFTLSEVASAVRQD